MEILGRKVFWEKKKRVKRDMLEKSNLERDLLKREYDRERKSQIKKEQNLAPYLVCKDHSRLKIKSWQQNDFKKLP